MEHSQLNHQTQFWKSAVGLAFLVVVLVCGFYLVTEHQAHLYGAAPYLFLLVCPLLHNFMHRGHHHGRHRDISDRPARDLGSVGGRERE